MNTASPASGRPLFCMRTVTRRPPPCTIRWTVPGANHAITPASSGVSAYPPVLSVWTAPPPAFARRLGVPAGAQRLDGASPGRDDVGLGAGEVDVRAATEDTIFGFPFVGA